jgi:hypothetical protein
MARSRALLASIIAGLAGSALVVTIVRSVSPYNSDQQLNGVALLGLLTGVFLLVGGVGALIALYLHQRWPALAGVKARQRRQAPRAEAALRQGILVGLVAVVLIALSILRVLDITVLLVTLLLAGLVETYAQSRT